MSPTSLLLALILGIGSAATAGHALAQPTEAAALTVEVANPRERRWPDTIPASGWLRPWHEAVIAAEVDGLRVTDVLVDIGSVVTRGQPLLRLDDAGVRAELRKAEAALATAEADRAKAEANAERARRVKASGALSEEKIADYLIAEQTAVAGVQAAEASLETQRIRLAQATITAVDDGLITARSAQLGAVFTTGTELFRLVREQRIEWQAEVSARHLSRIREGMTAIFDGPDGRQVKGAVRLVAPTVSSDTGRGLAYVALPPGEHLPSGLFASGRIEFGTTPALTVPEAALVLRDGFAYVFVVDPNARASRIRVETGRRNDGEVEILSGLERPAEVVTAGGAFLSDGALVRVEGEALVRLEGETP